MRRGRGALLLAASRLSSAFAVETHVWEQSDQADFTRGTAKNLSIRSDGHLSLLPSSPNWTAPPFPICGPSRRIPRAHSIYAGGAPTGATAKIFALHPGWQAQRFAELTGLEVHALAVDSEDRVYAAVLPDAKIYRIDKSGKPELFFDPKCKYIWSMAFDQAGNLFVATGDPG